MGDENNNISAQEIYGANAVLSGGSSQTIEIQTTGTQKFETVVGQQEQTQEQPTEQKTEGQTQEQTPEEKPEGQPTVEEQVKSQIEAGKALEADLTSRGVDFKALETEYVTKGQLSAESLATLEKAGYPKSVVDHYISGMQATAVSFENEVYSLVGGREQFLTLREHIAKGTPAQISAFDLAIDTGNITQIDMILKGVKADLESTRGTNNQQIIGGSAGNQKGGTQGFTSKAEMVKAMSDKRYGRDKGYTKSIEAKMAVTNF